MKKATGTKEGDHRLDEFEKSRSVLTLVPQTEKGFPKRTYRIDISNDVFMRREDARATSADSVKRDGKDAAKANPHGFRPRGRVEPVIVFAAAGLILGFLLGWHTRE